MIREISIACVAFLIAGCGERAPVEEAAAPEAPAAAAPAQASQTLQGPAAYVGRWAATPELCENGAWEFQARALSTAGEVSCQFDQVTPTASGFDIEARCVAQAPETRHTLTLTLTDPAPPQSMTAAGGPWSGSVTLMRCEAS